MSRSLEKPMSRSLLLRDTCKIKTAKLYWSQKILCYLPIMKLLIFLLYWLHCYLSSTEDWHLWHRLYSSFWVFFWQQTHHRFVKCYHYIIVTSSCFRLYNSCDCLPPENPYDTWLYSLCRILSFIILSISVSWYHNFMSCVRYCQETFTVI